MSAEKAPRVVLKRGREAAVLRRHPWVFSGSVANVEGDPGMGDLVSVVSSRREFLAWGHYSPHSQIRVRLLAWEESPMPDSAEFWRSRVERALNLRADLLADESTTACRLIYAESDGVPGLIVDRYNDVAVAQLLTAGIDARRELFADVLWDLLTPRIGISTLYERSDVDAREREGLAETTGQLRGKLLPETVSIQERGLDFLVDVRHGHKTGFYLDQRNNREQVRECVRTQVDLGSTPSVLNAFSYTGGFCVYALAGGAGLVVNIDTSADALALGRQIRQLNQQGGAPVEDIEGDVFEVLRQFRDQDRHFDLIILDPPKFAFTQRDVQSAARGYKDINLQAIHLLNPGGLLFTFSCSGAISDDLLQKIVFGAALDTGRDVQIVGRLMQGGDHPIALTFPEAAYLKGLVCRAVS